MRQIKLMQIFIIICLFIPIPVRAQVPIDSMESMKKAAEEGDSFWQRKMGFNYEWGLFEGIKPDYTEAVKWYRKAAEQGDTLAQYYLGVMYTVLIPA